MLLILVHGKSKTLTAAHYLDPDVTRTDFFFPPVSWFFLTVLFFFFPLLQKRRVYNQSGMLIFSIRADVSLREFQTAFVTFVFWLFRFVQRRWSEHVFGIWTRGLDGVYAIYSLWNVIYDICVAGKWIFLVEMTVDVFFWGACLQISNKGGLKMKIFMF